MPIQELGNDQYFFSDPEAQLLSDTLYTAGMEEAMDMVESVLPLPTNHRVIELVFNHTYRINGTDERGVLVYT